MISIDPGQVTPALSSLFTPDIPTGIRCFAVLAGGNSGKILTDDPDHPLWAYVWEADDGILYRGGTQEQDVLQRVIAILRQDGAVALGYRDGDLSVNLFPAEPDVGEACLEFDRPPGSSDLAPYLGALPAGYEIHRMNRTLLESSPELEDIINRYGSIDNFLTTGMAFCILRGDETVCEAYADIEVMGVREIGVVTQKAYRGQGFATLACAHLIQVCEEAGLQTYWDCAKLNLASAAVACKLGFRNEREYKLLAWFPLKETRKLLPLSWAT
jgi:GNAT superfamily N-acetyltransferase